MIKFLKRLLTPFRAPTAKERAAQMLAEAEDKLLESCEAVEWASAMVSYNKAKAERMRRFLEN